MDEHLAEWKLADAKLKRMGSPIDECILITLVLELFGGGEHNEFGVAITALQTQENLSGQIIVSRMFQKYESRESERMLQSKNQYE